MRSDFRVMRDVAVHTRLTPEQRQQSLFEFLRRVNSSEQAKKLLSDWGLRLDNAPINFEVRAFNIFESKIDILFGGADKARR
jgi:aubergine